VLDLNPILVLGASLCLIGMAMVVSIVLKLGFERSIAWASVRATVQLGVVGVLLSLILDTQWEGMLAAVWVGGMVLVAGWVTSLRAGTRSIFPAATMAIGSATALSLAVVFGFSVLPFEPIQVVVVAGITIGNALTGTVVAADQIQNLLGEFRLRVEGLLALGFHANQASMYIVREAVRVALLPHIERTKVVGLVSLPGAMTGLLIAGVDPIDAVVIQLVVMLLVLGTVAMSTTVVAVITARGSFTPDQRLKPDPQAT
jgi:putative ABC transport system permease protein